METYDLIDAIQRAILVIALGGILIIEARESTGKPVLWKLSIWFGILGNGISGIGYVLPRLIPSADRIGLTTNMLMVLGAVFSYWNVFRKTADRAARLVILREVAMLVILVVLVGGMATVYRTTLKVETSNQDIKQWMESVDAKLDQLDHKGTVRDGRLDNLEGRSYQASRERSAIAANQVKMQATLGDILSGVTDLLGLQAPRRKRSTVRSKAIPLPIQPIPAPKQLPTEQPSLFRRWFGPKTSASTAPAGRPGQTEHPLAADSLLAGN